MKTRSEFQNYKDGYLDAIHDIEEILDSILDTSNEDAHYIVSRINSCVRKKNEYLDLYDQYLDTQDKLNSLLKAKLNNE